MEFQHKTVLLRHYLDIKRQFRLVKQQAHLVLLVIIFADVPGLVCIHNFRTQTIELHHLGKWIEVSGLCLEQLILQQLDNFDNTLGAVGTRTNDRNRLDEHTHDIHHSYVGTSVVDSRDDNVVFASHCMQDMHSDCQEVAVQG